MNELLEQILRSETVEDRDGTTHSCSEVTITRETAECLYAFVRAAGPRRTIEIGMAYALSTLCICQALRDNGDGRHTAIDPYQASSFGSIGLLNVERAALRDLLVFHEARSDEVLPGLHRDGERFDFAFIDGSHVFDDTLVDFFFVDKLLPAGGCVAFDDLWMPAVRKVVSFVLRNRPYRLRQPCPGRVPIARHILRSTRRLAQNPLGIDWRLKLLPTNVAFLEKLSDGDERSWNDHRAF